MKKILLSLALVALCTSMFAQGAKNIKINEVVTNNSASIQDEFGKHLPWVELTNKSFSTYNIRGMYISTNRATLNKQLSAPERIKMMSIIPNGDTRTSIGRSGASGTLPEFYSYRRNAPPDTNREARRTYMGGSLRR